MTTLYTMISVPEVQITPDWMREERYMYCDHFLQDLHRKASKTLWSRIKKAFS